MLFVLLIIFSICSFSLDHKTKNIMQSVLPNGVRLHVEKSTDKDKDTILIVYNVGMLHDGKINEMAHLNEHLISMRFQNEAISYIRKGFWHNASTLSGATVFMSHVPPIHISFAIRSWANNLKELLIFQGAIYKELNIIKSEDAALENSSRNISNEILKMLLGKDDLTFSQNMFSETSVKYWNKNNYEAAEKHIIIMTNSNVKRIFNEAAKLFSEIPQSTKKLERIKPIKSNRRYVLNTDSNVVTIVIPIIHNFSSIMNAKTIISEMLSSMWFKKYKEQMVESGYLHEISYVSEFIASSDEGIIIMDILLAEKGLLHWESVIEHIFEHMNLCLTEHWYDLIRETITATMLLCDEIERTSIDSWEKAISKKLIVFDEPTDEVSLQQACLNALNSAKMTILSKKLDKGSKKVKIQGYNKPYFSNPFLKKNKDLYERMMLITLSSAENNKTYLMTKIWKRIIKRRMSDLICQVSAAHGSIKIKALASIGILFHIVEDISFLDSVESELQKGIIFPPSDKEIEEAKQYVISKEYEKFSQAPWTVAIKGIIDKKYIASQDNIKILEEMPTADIKASLNNFFTTHNAAYSPTTKILNKSFSFSPFKVTNIQWGEKYFMQSTPGTSFVVVGIKKSLLNIDCNVGQVANCLSELLLSEFRINNQYGYIAFSFVFNRGHDEFIGIILVSDSIGSDQILDFLKRFCSRERSTSTILHAMDKEDREALLNLSKYNINSFDIIQSTK